MPSIPSFRNTGPISKTRSIPPITNLFSQSSGAILKLNDLSENSVENVVKGRATAPPAERARIGVCTSWNCWSSRYWRRDCMMWERSLKVSNAFWCIRRSAWRFLTNVAGSLRVVGREARAGLRRVGSDVAWSESSPFACRLGVPLIAEWVRTWYTTVILDDSDEWVFFLVCLQRVYNGIWTDRRAIAYC